MREPTVELAHEALLHTWGRLRAWVDAAREDLLARRRLSAATAEWADAGRDPSFLAQGARLAQFADLAESGRLALNTDERAFLVMSLEERDHLARQERQRQQRELEQAHDLAETQRRRAEEQEASGRRLRRRAILLALVALVALVAAGSAAFFGLSARQSARVAEVERATADSERQRSEQSASTAEAERTRAEQQSRIATVRQLVASANAQAGDAGETAVLLALEAVGHDPSPFTFEALRSAMTRPLWGETELESDGDGRFREMAFSPDGQRVLGLGSSLRAWDAGGKQLFDLAGDIRAAAISPDSALVLAATGAGAGLLLDGKGDQIAVLAGHDPAQPLTRVAISADGERLLTGSADGTARLWDRAGRPLAVLQGHSGPLSSVAFNPRDSSILTRSDDGTARVWAADGRPVATLAHEGEPIANAQVGGDGERILTVSETVARLWDAQGQLIAQLSDSGETIRRAALSRDGSRVRVWTYGAISVWDAQGELVASLDPGLVESNLINVTLSPDGRHIVTIGGYGYAELWDISGQTEGGRPQQVAVFRSSSEYPDGVRFSPDGAYVLIYDDENLDLFQASGEYITTLARLSSEITEIVFSPDSRRVLARTKDGTARLWQIRDSGTAVLAGHNDQLKRALFNAGGDHILTLSDRGARLWTDQGALVATLSQGYLSPSAAFSPPGDRVLICAENTAQIWDLAGQLVAELRPEGQHIDGAVYNHDGGQVLTYSEEGAAQLWTGDGDLITSFQAYPPFQDHPDGVEWAGFTAGGRRIVTASINSGVRLWELDGRLVKELLAPDDEALALVTLSPDGARLVTGSFTSGTRLWDDDGRLVAQLEGDKASAFFSPDGGRLLTSSFKATRLYDRDGRQIADQAQDSVVNTGALTSFSALFSRDGTLLTYDTFSSLAQLWGADGALLAELKGHADRITGAAFSPDGALIVTASEDGTARIWGADGQLRATLRGHTSVVSDAVFSPDGGRVLTASEDGTARIYLARDEDLLAAAACAVARPLSDEEIATFQVPTPLGFDFGARQCPPRYSWEQGR
ncbi:MAG: hypothetical protein HGA45_05025 [Chloroflexales bacterium]|nr:hypothetical protein [Chloroflexales bacterium]